MFETIQNHTYHHATDFDFEVLCALLFSEKYDLAMQKIKKLAATISKNSLLFDANNYTRNIIISNQHQWLGLVNWDKNAQTCIHGHPQRAFVCLLSGQLQVQNFDINPLTKREIETLRQGEYCASNGIQGKMDNHVHQVRAQQKSLSLHFYSGDPAQGDIFDI